MSHQSNLYIKGNTKPNNERLTQEKLNHVETRVRHVAGSTRWWHSVAAVPGTTDRHSSASQSLPTDEIRSAGT